MPLKILHIAPQNFAGMPYDFALMHRCCGDESRLVTLYRNTLDFPEDVCIGFSLPSGKASSKWRNSKAVTSKVSGIKYYKPANAAEHFYFAARDFLNKPKIERAIEKFQLYDFDIYHFDGGMDLFRDCRFAIEIKKRGKKIVCCYFGSDLRTRGIFREIDEISDMNLTVEFDHLSIRSDINYIYFPFDTGDYAVRKRNNRKLRILHSPTNRKFKGTEKILEVIEQVSKSREIEFVLLENMPRQEVLKIKATCDLAIDQVGGELGGSGYGRNSIENLSLGVPTFTEFSEEYLSFINENPFVHSTISTLKDNLIAMIDNEQLRNDAAAKGRAWVEKYHSYGSVNSMLMDYYHKYGII